MNPRVIAISGTIKGTIFALSENEISVGRESSNAISLDDPSISRRHCVIRRQTLNRTGEPHPPTSELHQFTIIDLDSFNGTFVNSVPIKEHTLAHGDQIALGDVQFLFVTHTNEGDAESSSTAHPDEADLITRSTVRLRHQDAFYLNPERVGAELSDSRGHSQATDKNSRVARDLNTLLKISATINSIRNRRELQCHLLELISAIIPAEREAILLMAERYVADTSHQLNEGLGPFASICGWNRLTGLDDSLKASQTIANQVLREGVALLSNDLFESEGLGESPSLIAARVCSVLCVPLVAFDKPLGVIYLDTSDPLARFDEAHLQLLTAIAGIAAVAFNNVDEFEELKCENQRLQEEIKLEHRMIGESLPMRQVYGFLAKVAPTPSTVLIRGESGTGKELAAQAIHQNSPRATKAFVAINCATLTETLLESELFGHEKGSFTGAIAQKRGKLEVAEGGTVFLDEVGELTPLIQAKLLRVLQEREFERVGGTRAIKVDVRIIAATNNDLEQAIKNGSFRQDLYYRLNVVSVTMPPLRERREDISLLASYFAAKYSKHCKRKISGISPEARNTLRSYDWPGNVRELENAIERAVVLGSSESIRLEDLPETLLESEHVSNPKSGYYDAVSDAKKGILTKTLEQTGGNYTEAAKLLGLHPNNLHRLIRTLNLKASLKSK